MIDNANGPSLKVLVADKIAPAGLDLLKSNFAVDVKTGLTEADLCRIIGDYHALVVRSATKVTGRVIEKAFNLKVIARAGAGLDNIDVAAALTQGIEVVNAPNANTKAVAEHTLGLILALARRLPEADLSLKSGLWKKAALTGTGLYGKTLGIVGFGKIGREVTRRALAFGMQVVVNQRRLTPELALEAGIQAVDLVDLLKTSDFVTLHVPLKPETKNLIGAEQLALMKPDAYLINTARGDVVDEAALLAALNDGRLAGAALDVFSEEPARHSQLARHPKVIATPHIAASTGDAQRAAAITVVEQILEILAAGDEGNALSLEVLPLPNVLPHEQTDPSRVQRLVNRLSAEKVLKNPPIVTKWKDHYVVLDGATRVTALKALDYRYVVAQVVPHTHNNLGVHVWNHVIEGVSVESLLKLIEDLPEVRYVAVDLAYVQDSMLELGGLCYMVLRDHTVLVIQPAREGSRLDALNALVAGYINLGDVSRTLCTDFDEAVVEFPNMVGLFVYPAFTIEQILQISSVGKVVPAGITRFIIPGRVLRLNLDLTRLKKDEPKALKTAWLNKQVRKLVANHHIRYYEEPVYLLDE